MKLKEQMKRKKNYYIDFTLNYTLILIEATVLKFFSQEQWVIFSLSFVVDNPIDYLNTCKEINLLALMISCPFY